MAQHRRRRKRKNLNRLPEAVTSVRWMGRLARRLPSVVRSAAAACDVIEIFEDSFRDSLLRVLGNKQVKIHHEKPVSHNMAAGRIAVWMARKYGRTVQHGTNRRGSPQALEAAKLFRDGIIGKLMRVKAINNLNDGDGCHPMDAEPMPAGLNYALQ